MHPATLALAALLVLLSGIAGAFLARRAAARAAAPGEGPVAAPIAAPGAAPGATREADALRASLDQIEACEARLRELNQQIAALRHDLRGILSPAMLVADRLLDNPDPGVKRAGELVIRTVERMTARLAETRLGQDMAGGSKP